MKNLTKILLIILLLARILHLNVQGSDFNNRLSIDLVPRLAINGLIGETTRLERSQFLDGPWLSWTNIVLDGTNADLVDFQGNSSFFYRITESKDKAFSDLRPVGYAWIPAGTFLMGNSDALPLYLRHQVTLTQGFWMSDHEVTCGEYQQVMGSTPSEFQDPNFPVIVPWWDADTFCKKLTEKDRSSGAIDSEWVYRLPTESEWEYACRAGTTNSIYGDIELIAATRVLSRVKTKLPNSWGLYDMLGNVAEWCSDWLGPYPVGNVVDPTGPIDGPHRVRRGQSFYNLGPMDPNKYFSAYTRNRDFEAQTIGFRVILSKGRLPRILSQPESMKVVGGQDVAFSVHVVSDLPVKFQWQLNGKIITGETNSCIKIQSTRNGDSGEYRVFVESLAGRVVSTTATLEFVKSATSTPNGFVWIPPGQFEMGSPLSEIDRSKDESQHTVIFTQGYFMCDHEVTQEEYQNVMGDNPSSFIGNNFPVDNITYARANIYCLKLTEIHQKSGVISDMQIYRLPTEAEWEYACRAGTFGAQYSELGAIAWYSGSAGWEIAIPSYYPVKQKKPNAWGLYDMIGNVSEYCSDFYGEYPQGIITDPKGPIEGVFRVKRGGNWASRGTTFPPWPEVPTYFSSLRSAARITQQSFTNDRGNGFRVVISSTR